jgi:hypothetical protein
MSLFGQHHGQVAGLLDSPRPGRMRRDPGHVHPADVHLDEKSARRVSSVAPCRQGKKSQASIDDAWLRRSSFQLGPLRIGERIHFVPAQDGPDARGGESNTQYGELTLDAPIAPGGILSCQSQDDCHGAGGDARAPRSVRLGPFATDQIPVPTEQGLGLDEEPPATAPIKEPTQPGEHRSIRRLQRRGQPDDGGRRPRGGASRLRRPGHPCRADRDGVVGGFGQ